MDKFNKLYFWMILSSLIIASLACGLISSSQETPPTETAPPPPTDTIAPTDVPPTGTPLPTEPPPTTEPGPTPTGSEPTTGAPTATSEPAGQIEVLDLIYQEEFDGSSSDWGLGITEDDFVQSESEISDGHYRWYVTAKQPVVRFELAEPPVELPEGRFDYTASIMIEDNPTEISYGLVFRAQDVDNYYYFQLTTDGYFAVFALVNNEWEQLIDFTTSEYLHEGIYNNIEVHADGSSYEFKINDFTVAQLEDDRFNAGNIGLAIEFNDPGDSGVMVVDNLRVWVPGSGAAAREEFADVKFNRITVETYNTAEPVIYELEIPDGWSYTTAQGFEIICEQEIGELCFSSFVQDDWQGDDVALQEHRMALLYDDEFSVLNAQHTEINGLPAYFISYTYDVDGEIREGVAVYLVIDGYGFELRSFGSATSIEIYREVINHFFESFTRVQPQ